MGTLLVLGGDECNQIPTFLHNTTLQPKLRFLGPADNLYHFWGAQLPGNKEANTQQDLKISKEDLVYPTPNLPTNQYGTAKGS